MEHNINVPASKFCHRAVFFLLHLIQQIFEEHQL